MRAHEPPSAFAAFGESSWLVPPARITGAGAISIGSRVVVMEHSSLSALGAEAKLTLADGVRLARFNTIVCELEVSLGPDVASSDGATIMDTWNHPLARERRTPGLDPAPVVIERGAYLGMNSAVLPGVRVGEGAYVGECAVVVEDVPAHSVVYGNPATVVRRYDEASRRWDAVV